MTRDEVSEAIFGSFDGVVSVIGLATVVGTLCPVVPFMILGKSRAIVVALLVVLVISLAIARVRARRSAGHAYAETFGVLLLAAGVTALVSWLTAVA